MVSKRRGSRLRAIGMALVALSAIGADCAGNVVKDPTFRDWCGDTLCAWQLDAGHIQRVPTWNENDFGVAFLDTPTQISQVTGEHGATCLLFTSVADIDPAAQVTVAVDFNADGSIEYTAPLGATQWHKVQTEIGAPAVYNGIRFILRKDGAGAAILAEMQIQSTTGCTSQPQALSQLAMGEPCSTDAECSTGVCETDQFFGPRECAQCSASKPCPGAVKCQSGNFGFSQCGPGQRAGAVGDPCVANDDCRSGTCQGATVVSDPVGGEAGSCDLNAPPGYGDCGGDDVRGGKCL